MTLDGKLEYWTAGNKPINDEGTWLNKVQYTVEIPHPEREDLRFVYTVAIENLEKQNNRGGVFDNLMGVAALTSQTKVKKQIKRRRLRSYFPLRIETAIKEVWKNNSPPITHYGDPFTDYSVCLDSIRSNFPPYIIKNGELTNRLETKDSPWNYVGMIVQRFSDPMLNYDFVASLFRPIEEFIWKWYKPWLERDAKIAQSRLENWRRRR